MGIAVKHLSESRRAEIAKGLYTVTKVEEAKGEIHGYCPIHQESEHSPSPSFAYNFIKDSYHCFSCGADGDLIKLWSEVHGHGQKEGFKAFCEAYGVPFGKDAPDAQSGAWKGKPDARPDVVLSIEETLELMRQAWEKFPSLPSDWIARLEKERGWSAETIKQLDIRLQTWRLDKKTGKLKEISRTNRLAIPIFDEHSSLYNIRLYQPGAKQYKIISFANSTGEARLFPARPEGGSIVLLCEGESDTLCAISHGFNAITQTSKLKNWPGDHLRPFRDRDVVIAYDADNAGRVYADYAGAALQPVARSVRVITWPEFMDVGPDGSVPKDHGQDLTDFFVRHRRGVDDLNHLIEASKPFSPLIPPAPPGDDERRTDGIYRFYDYGVNKRYSFRPRLLAEQILKDMVLMYEPETGLTYKWNGRFWDILHEDYIKAECLKYLENESQKSRVEDATFQARMLCSIPTGRKINDRAGYFCVENGMYSIDEDFLHPHAQEFYATFMFPVIYDPEGVPICKRWLLFLEETIQTPAVIAQIQEFFGYCLTPSTAFEKCLLCLGPGADGKSTLLKILRAMVGPKNCAAVNIEDLDDQFQRSSLYGKLLNISTEVGSKAMESKIFKAVISGDSIQAAFKHENSFEFEPTCKMAFAANRFPRVLDNSDGFFRKILPVQFKKQFLVGGDKGLLDTLKGELSGIFHWSLIGRQRLWEQKDFTECDETSRIMLDYRRSNNPVLCFAEDELEFGDPADQAYEAPKKEVYILYENYCKDKGYQKFSEENFFRELKAARHNLEQYRPQINGRREYRLKGVRIAQKPGEGML
jgi:putative DNA primase/helicase